MGIPKNCQTSIIDGDIFTDDVPTSPLLVLVCPLLFGPLSLCPLAGAEIPRDRGYIYIPPLFDMGGMGEIL